LQLEKFRQLTENVRFVPEKQRWCAGRSPIYGKKIPLLIARLRGCAGHITD
jgi:hypothetical protein